MADDEVVDNPAASRFEMRVGTDGELAVLDYERQGSRLHLTRAEVPHSHRGHGHGLELVRGSLELVRAAGAVVVPECPFVRWYIQRHPEYADLVSDA